MVKQGFGRLMAVEGDNVTMTCLAQKHQYYPPNLYHRGYRGDTLVKNATGVTVVSTK